LQAATLAQANITLTAAGMTAISATIQPSVNSSTITPAT